MVRLGWGVACAFFLLLLGGCFGKLRPDPSQTDAASAGSGSKALPRATSNAGANGGPSAATPAGGRPSSAAAPSHAGAGGRAALGAADVDAAAGSAGAPDDDRLPSGVPTERDAGLDQEADASAQGGAGPAAAGTGGAVAPENPDELEAETRGRWNLIADNRPPSDYDFHWDQDQFPHPTFQLGTPEGYHEFAFVLDAFLGNEDDFAFLAKHDLFELPLRYLAPSGDDLLDTSFAELADFFATTDYGDIPADVQARLLSASARIQALD